MPTDENRAKVDQWIAVAPDNRVVETRRNRDRWETQALEDGDVVYEETDFGTDEPELNLLAAWCERQGKRAEPRPPVKTTGAVLTRVRKSN